MKEKLKIFILAILPLFCLYNLASAGQPSNIKIEVIKKKTTLIVLFDGKNNQFGLTNSGQDVTLNFEKDIIFTDLSKLSSFDQFIKNSDIQSRKISFQLASNNLKVNKFQIANKTGIEIFKSNINEKTLISNNQNLNSENYNVLLSEYNGETVITFKFDKDAAATSFFRGNRLWIIFDKPLASQKLDVSSKRISEFTREKSEDSISVFSMKVNTDNEKTPTTLMYREGNNWNLQITDKSIKTNFMRVVSRPFAAPFPRVDVELDEPPSDPIRFYDNYVGQELIALPIKSSAIGINENYTFVDFKILKSLQGIIVEPISDTIKVTQKDWLYQIMSTSGLNIATRVFKKKETKFAQPKFSLHLNQFVDDSHTILTLKGYEANSGEFSDTINKFMQSVINTVDQKERAKIHANWALFYLANSFYLEGLEMLKLLKEEDKEFGESYSIKLIEAALNFMDRKYLNAYQLARSISMIDVPINLRKEVRFWQTITSYSVNNAQNYLTRLDPLEIYMDYQYNFLTEYSDNFMFEIAMTIAENKLKERRIAESKTIVNRILDIAHSQQQKNRSYNIAGKLNEIMNNYDEATGYWEKCANDIEDMLYRSICRYELANFKSENFKISDHDYIEELERIALIWRGDDLEIDLLQRLGDKYLEMNDYSNALKNWDTIVKYFPYSPVSLGLGRKMGSTFIKFFLEKKIDEVSHLDALTLFYDFEHLVPVGELGDKIVSKFVDHLIALDLLDRASLMLQHQVDERLKGTEREVDINKLAKVYLDNKQPIKAISAINSGDKYGELPISIAKERRRLHARALHLNQQDKEALELVKNDTTQEGDDINALIYWSDKNWGEYIKFVEPRIYQIRYQKGVISSDDARRVLKLSLAYVLLNKFDLLDVLIEDFKDKMPEKEKYTLIFQTIAKSWNSIKAKNLETGKALSLMQETVSDILKIMKNTGD